MTLLDLLQNRFSDVPRETLLAWVLCGEIEMDGHVVRDPQCLVDARTQIKNVQKPPFVSRGGINTVPAPVRPLAQSMPPPISTASVNERSKAE